MASRSLASPLGELLHPLTSGWSLRTALAAPALRRIYLPPIILPAFAPLITLPSLLSDIWEGLLRAVPKKKTSYSRTRSRQLAGKALKDVTALSKCSGCGRTKRMHVLCPYCVQDIKDYWKTQAKTAKQTLLESKSTDPEPPK